MSTIRIFVSIVLLSLMLACSDSVENYYDDYMSMKKSDSYRKGWIPENIPKSAKNIYERHDLDVNKVWIRFQCDSADITHLVSQLNAADTHLNVVSILKKNFNLPRKSSYFIFTEKEFFAINYERKLVYYHRSNYGLDETRQ